MASIKSQLAEIIQEQPEDATYEEIIRELSFNRMVERVLQTYEPGRSLPMTKWREGSGHGRNDLDRRSRNLAQGYLRLGTGLSFSVFSTAH
jgi:hypothetical protein